MSVKSSHSLEECKMLTIVLSWHQMILYYNVLSPPTELDGDIGNVVSVPLFLFLCSSVQLSSPSHFWIFCGFTDKSLIWLNSNFVAELIVALSRLNCCSRPNKFQTFPCVYLVDQFPRSCIKTAYWIELKIRNTYVVVGITTATPVSNTMWSILTSFNGFVLSNYVFAVDE